MTIRCDGLSANWLGYATVRIEYEDFVAYLDPGRYGTLTGEWSGEPPHPPSTDYDARDGDLVCITHDHHYDSEGIARVASDDATIVLYDAVDPTGIDRDVEGIEALPGDAVRIGEREDFTLEGGMGVDIETLPAYNHPDGPNTSGGEPIHPEGFGCGYLIDVGGARIFWPGDSDVLDAHYGLDVSLFLPSISSSFTMDRHGAADLAESLDPDLTLPIHYNTFEALEADSGAFAADVAERSVPVVLDERE